MNQQNAIVVTEQQAEMIFACLEFCRKKVSKKPEDTESEKDITKLMRLFVWRD